MHLSVLSRSFQLHSDAISDLIYSDLVLLDSTSRSVVIISAVDGCPMRLIQWIAELLQYGDWQHQVAKQSTTVQTKRGSAVQFSSDLGQVIQ